MNHIKIVCKLSRAKFAKLLRGNMSVLYKKLTFAIHNPLILTEVSFCKSEEHISDFPSPQWCTKYSTTPTLLSWHMQTQPADRRYLHQHTQLFHTWLGVICGVWWGKQHADDTARLKTKDSSYAATGPRNQFALSSSV